MPERRAWTVQLAPVWNEGDSSRRQLQRRRVRGQPTREAREHGARLHRPVLHAGEVVLYLEAEATRAPELRNQQSYLARVVSFDRERGIVDEGILALAYFVDAAGPDAVAMAVETDRGGNHYPVTYVRRNKRVIECALDSHILLDFETPRHRARLDHLLRGLL